MSGPVILVTGGTGFVGGAVLAEWLQSDRPGRVLALVRAASDDDAFDRVHRSVSRFGGTISRRSERVQVRAGTLSSILEDPRLETATHVLHLAAETSFLPGPDTRKTNVDAALRLAFRMREVGGLRRYLHVSTAMICGDDPGRVVREDDFPRDGVRHLVAYSESKAEAELGLPDDPRFVVARPSIVVGHTSLGCEPSASIFWAFRAMHQRSGRRWGLPGRIDVVPVDWTATALLDLLQAPTLRHRVYHLSAGPARASRLSEIATALGPIPRREPLGARVLGALRMYRRFAALDVVFDNARLLAEGVLPPPTFLSYLPTCLRRSRDRSIEEQMRDDAEAVPQEDGARRRP